MTITVKQISQETDYQRSFNVLVPLSIQGKSGVLIQRGKAPNRLHGSISHTVEIDGKRYFVPSWSIVDAEGRDVKVDRN